MNKKFFLILVICAALILSVTTVVYARGRAKAYYGLTTVGYGNTIVDQGNGYWGATHIDYTTNPYRYMDQLGVTVWTTYVRCGQTIQYDTYTQYTSVNQPWLIYNDVRSYGDTMAKQDVDCEPNEVLSRVNYIQHFWQDSGYAGDGDSLNKIVPAGTNFSDVPVSHWAYYYIEPMYQIGIMDAAAIQYRCATYRAFCPNSYVRRDEMAYFLERGMRGANYEFPTSTGVFSDVPTYYWSAAVIEQLYADGITAGCAVNPLRFCPGNGVTRAEMAVFLLKAEHGSSYSPPPVGSSTGFADVPVSHWAAAWIKQLYAEGITGGCNVSPLMYCPNNRTSRAEMAVFLNRTFAP